MNGNTIQVGILYSLTGTMAISETPLLDASLMAIAQINERGGVLGKSIEAVIEDGASDPEIFRQKAQKLILQDQVATVFGCWTSLSRKAVLPVFEQHNNLLWYPLQYEGLEQSPNIFYGGSCPNQQVCPAVDWLLAQKRTRFYLIGSNYVFPRTVNNIVKGQLRYQQGINVGEVYVPLGETDFQAIIQDIKSSQPDVVFSTLNGDSNLAFYQQYQDAGIAADDIPIMALSLSEIELQYLKNLATGHFASWSYFQSLDTTENREFIQAFQQQYGSQRVTSDPIESAYNQVYLWKQAVALAKSIEVNKVRAAAYGQIFNSPGGSVQIESNHHLKKKCYIGQILPSGQFKIVAGSDELIKPLPWLGVEEQTFPHVDVVIDLLQEVSQGIQYSWELEQKSKALDSKNQEMTSYIQQVQIITDAAVAVEQEQFDPAILAALATSDDDLGQLARIFTRMVQTIKTREQELAEAKDHLEAVLNAVPGSISWVNSAGVYLGVNRHLAESFNLSQDAFIGKNVGFMKRNDKLENFLNSFIKSPDQSAEIVVDIESKNNRRYYLLVAQKYQQGGATVTVGLDITERKLAEDSLRIAEENYRSIFENALEGIFQSSPEGRFINVNPALAKIYGYDSPTEMIESITDIREQLYVDPEKRTEFKELLDKQGKVKEFEYRCYCKDGRIVWVQIDARAVKDSHDQLLYYEGMVQDITDRKGREDDLRKQLAELKIEIDQTKRKKEVAMLTESSYFQEVQQEMAEINLDEFWS